MPKGYFTILRGYPSSKTKFIRMVGGLSREIRFLLAVSADFVIISGMKTVESSLFDNPKEKKVRTGLAARRPRSLRAFISPGLFCLQGR